MEVIIRHAEKKDIKGIQELYCGKNAYTGTLQLPSPSLAMWEKRLSDIPDGVYVFIAEMNGKVVGNLGLEVAKNVRRKHVASFGMAVHDEHQNEGIGSKLLEKAIDLADNWLNLKRVELTVYTDNAPAIAMYKKYGFEIEGEAKQFAFRNGEYVDTYYMARIKN